MDLTPIIILIVLITFIIAKDAPFVPTRKRDVERFLSLANIKPGEKMYDLGSGDGRLVIESARSGAIATGIEFSLLPFLFSYLKKILSDNGRVKFLFKNIWSTNISDADLVYIWLMPEVNLKMRDKLERELRTGARVITYIWPIEDWTPDLIDSKEGMPNLYLYTIK